MPIRIGTEKQNAYKIGTIEVLAIYQGTEPMWVPSGTATFTVAGDNIFSVPPGAKYLQACMVGGGGSGAIHGEDNKYPCGGKSGNFYTGQVTAIAGEDMIISVGSGGIAPTWPFDSASNHSQKGGNGTHTYFGPYDSNGPTATGGFGGRFFNDGYMGNGNPRTTCGGTKNDGTKQSRGYGGQSSGFAKGGNSQRITYNSAIEGSQGSGGGSIYLCTVKGVKAGTGGSGKAVFTWGID